MDTSDFIQDVLLRTIRRRSKFELRERRALGAYLHKAVENRVRDEFRRSARRGPHDTLDEQVKHPGRSPVELAIANEMWPRYRTALAHLASRDRQLIVGHLELEYSLEQLGCMIGRSRNAARVALHRAICRLLEQMGDA